MNTVPPHPWVSDLDEAVARAVQSEAAWKDLAHHALAESEVADQHEGRFLVELLQNVRDAWCMRPNAGAAGSVLADRPARAALVVTDRGLLVADQGAGFDLESQDVLDAVRYLRRSSKRGATDEARGLVGHWGIGLKAILRRCQAFQVWSHVGTDSGSPRRIAADFRRSRTLDALRRAAAGATSEVREALEREVAFVPMFRFAHPLPPGAGAEDEAVVCALLGEVGAPPALAELLDGTEPFRTVVRLDFRDEAWLNALGSRRGDDRVRISDLDADAVWREVAALDLRTVLLLGTLGTVDLVRLADDVAVVEHVRLTVEPRGTRADLPGVSGGEHRRYRLSCTPASTARTGQVGEWDVFAAPAEHAVAGYDRVAEGLAEVCVAVPRADPGDVPTDLPLFMYYPVQPPEAERGEGLPFLLHGPFFVKPDRTGLDLGRVGRTRNAAVLDGARSVVAAAALALVREQAGEATGDAPWSLLPAPVGQHDGGLIANFRRTVLATLAESCVLPSAAGDLHAPASRRLLAAAGGPIPSATCADLSDLFGGAAPDLVPDARVMHRLEQWVARAWGGDTARASVLLGDKLPAEVLAEALARWAATFEAKQAHRVPRQQAAAVAASTLAALRGEPAAAQAFLQRVQAHDLPVIPCVDGAGTGDDGTRLLVRAAARRRAESGQVTAKPRVVLYRRQRGDSAESDDVPPLWPPDGVPLYLLDEPVWRPFHEFGVDLGLREDGGDPTLVEEVLSRALPLPPDRPVQSPREVAEICGYLGALLDRIGARRGRAGQEWLDAGPAGWMPVFALWRAVNPADAGQRREIEREASRWRNRLRATFVPLPAQGGDERPARELYVPASWADPVCSLLSGGADTGLPDRASVQDALRASVLHHAGSGRLAPLADPSDPRWDAWRAGLGATVPPDATGRALARLLLFLGVWITPTVEGRWLWPFSLGRHDGDLAGIVDERAGWRGLAAGDGVPADLEAALDGLLASPALDHAGDGIHYVGCTHAVATPGGPGGYGARVVRQAWFPDEGAAAFSEALAASVACGWLERVVATRWTCRCYGKGSRPSQWVGKRVLPTFAGLQARRAIEVSAQLGGEPLAAPLESVISGPSTPTEDAAKGLRAHVPRWSGQLRDRAVPEAMLAALRVPASLDEMDSLQAAAALASLAPRVDGTDPTGTAQGALVLLLRRALAPVAELLQLSKGEWKPAAPRAAARAVLTRACAFPVWEGGRLTWIQVEPRADLPAGVGLATHEGLPIVALGTRRDVNRYDRERLRGRVELLDPDGARHDPLPRRRELLEGLGVEVVVGTPAPELLSEDAPGADPDPYREHLAKRLPLLRAIADAEREKPLDDGVLEAAAASVRCVRGLAESGGGEPIPIPAAWQRPDGTRGGALLVDVDRVPPHGPMGDLAWGLVGAVDAHALLPKFMVALAVEEGPALASVVRALGVQTPAAPAGGSTCRRERASWLAALAAGGDVAAGAAELLAHASRKTDDRGSFVDLPTPLKDDAVVLRGVLGAPALAALLGRLAALALPLDPGTFLARAHLRFQPTPADLAGDVPRALRRLAAALVWDRADDGRLAAVTTALSATDAALRQATVTIAGALAHLGVAANEALGDALAGGSADVGLGARHAWGASDTLAADLRAASHRVATLPPEVDELLDKPTDEERRACVQAHEHAAAQHTEAARTAAWAELPSLASPAAALSAASLVASKRTASSPGAGGGGPTVQAQERGEIGEIVALRDVVARLLAAWAADPDPAVERLSRGLEYAAKLRPATGGKKPAAAPDARDLLARCAAGERAALDDLAGRLDVSDVRGPGFDLVDPLGPLSSVSSEPVRVEVKTTAEPVQAGGAVVFRLTVNELFRSQQGTEPFVVRVYHAPPPPALPRLQVEIPSPAALIEGLDEQAGQAVLASVRGGGHLVLTAALTTS